MYMSPSFKVSSTTRSKRGLKGNNTEDKKKLGRLGMVPAKNTQYDEAEVKALKETCELPSGCLHVRCRIILKVPKMLVLHSIFNYYLYIKWANECAGFCMDAHRKLKRPHALRNTLCLDYGFKKKMNLLKAITGTDSQDYQNFNVCNGKK